MIVVGVRAASVLWATLNERQNSSVHTVERFKLLVGLE